MNKTFFLRSQDVKRNCLAFIANLPADEDTPLVVKVSEMTRNLEQNALMWPLLECFSQQVRWPVNGNMQYLEPEEWKDLLSAAFKNETQRVAMGRKIPLHLQEKKGNKKTQVLSQLHLKQNLVCFQGRLRRK